MTPKSPFPVSPSRPSPNSKPKPPKPRAGSSKPASIISSAAPASSPSHLPPPVSSPPRNLRASLTPVVTSCPELLPAPAKHRSRTISNKPPSSRSPPGSRTATSSASTPSGLTPARTKNSSSSIFSAKSALSSKNMSAGSSSPAPPCAASVMRLGRRKIFHWPIEFRVQDSIVRSDQSNGNEQLDGSQ